ncbi:hypothetical protein N2152v2_004472 [Parachlorella kessleri]
MADSDELPSEEELEEEESGEEGSEEEGSEEEGSDEVEGSSDEDQPRRRPAKRQKAELPPPGRDMPQRATRGQRMGALVKDAEVEQADEEFWNQDFFREEEADEIYETESEPDDVPDQDFSESEGEDDNEEGEEAEAAARANEKKKKTLKPPGYKKPPLPPRPKPPGSGSKGPASGAGASRRRAPSAELDAQAVFERRAVRESTRQRVAEAEEERQLQAMLKPTRVVRKSSHRPLTQAELLSEAAKTEIENTKSLQALVAMEEQTKKKAEVKKARYKGPMLRFLSKAVNGEERSTVEVRNMQTPQELLPRLARPPVPKPVCAVTGLPAKYRDPQSGLPYANLQAYRALKAQQQQQALLAQPHAYFAPGFLPAQTQQQQPVPQWQAAPPQQHVQSAAMGQSWQQQQPVPT